MNSQALSPLHDFTSISHNLPNIIILGSVGLLAHTYKIGYERRIKDVDTICDISYKTQFENELTKLGYRKSTFIDSKMPFAKILRKFSEKYCRYYKQNYADLEILYTPFVFKNQTLTIELFPHISASIPSNTLETIFWHNIPIKTVSPEMMLVIKLFTHETLGSVYRTGHEKREADHTALRKCIDKNEFELLKKKLKFSIQILPRK